MQRVSAPFNLFITACVLSLSLSAKCKLLLVSACHDGARAPEADSGLVLILAIGKHRLCMRFWNSWLLYPLSGNILLNTVTCRSLKAIEETRAIAAEKLAIQNR